MIQSREGIMTEKIQIFIKLYKFAKNLSRLNVNEKYKTIYLVDNQELYEKILKYKGSLVFLSKLGYNLSKNDQLLVLDKIIKAHHFESCLESFRQRFKMLKESEMELREPDIEDFRDVASDIMCYNDKAYSVLCTLRSVSKRLLKDDPRWRTLDTTNPKVTERLINYEGVLDYLELLGFESDPMGIKLICYDKPPRDRIKNSIEALKEYEYITGWSASKKQKQKRKRNCSIGEWEETKNNDEIDSKQLTLEMIMNWKTYNNEPSSRWNDLMETVILIHKKFTTSKEVIKHLKRKFMAPIPNDLIIMNDIDKDKKIEEFQKDILKPTQLKVIKVLREWMKKYWMEDFDKNEQLQHELDEWMVQIKDYNDYGEYNKKCKWVPILYRKIEQELKRFREKKEEKKDDNVENMDDINEKLIDNCDVKELAEQLTLMEFELFKRIKERDWLKGIKKSKQENTGITKILQRNSDLMKFVQIKILKEKTMSNKSRMIKRFIKIGEELKYLRNYQSLSAIYNALQSAVIHRLKLAWNNVCDRNKNKYKQWKNIFDKDMSGHYRKIRKLMRGSIKPCIPDVYILKKDFITKKDDDSLYGITCFGEEFGKSMKYFERIKRINKYQENGYNESIKKDDKIQYILLNIFSNVRDITYHDLGCSRYTLG